jgi:hypothetical protein
MNIISLHEKRFLIRYIHIKLKLGFKIMFFYLAPTSPWVKLSTPQDHNNVYAFTS